MSVTVTRRHVLQSTGTLGVGAFAALSGIGAASETAFAAGTHLKILMQTHPATDAMRALAPAWSKQNGVQVSIEDLGPEQLLDKLRLLLSAGSSDYDVVGIFLDVYSQYQAAGWIVPLSTYVPGGVTDPDFVQSFVKGLTANGETCGLPFYGESTALTYNKAFFKSAGLTEAPTTYEELASYAKALTKPGKRQYGITLRGLRSGQNLLYIWAGFFYGFGGKFFDAEYTPIFASDAGAQSVDYYAELMNNYAPPGAADAGWDVTLSHMQQGLAAMNVDATVNGPQLEDPEKSLVVGKIGFAPIPKGPAGAFPSLFTYGLGIPKNCRNKAAAGQFIAWATGKTFESESVEQTLRGDVTRVSVWNKMKTMPKYEFDNGRWEETTLSAMAMANPDYRPRIPEWPQAADIISTAVSSVIAGEAKAKPALKDAQDKVAKIMKDAGYPKN